MAGAVAAAGGMLSTAAHAQAVEAMVDEIVVTATKRGEVNLQDVPLAATAYGKAQLDALHFDDLQSLSFQMPNVQLDDGGTIPGTANFSIRGLGINSTIPSVDPTVGVFVDGMYMGVTAGVVFDNFDLDGVEVLRGPQGVLFGRNVTGGAVILRTGKPRSTFEADARVSLESGPSWTASGVVTGPLAGDTLSAKLAVYYTKDEGWFENELDGREVGEARQWVVRPALRWTPNDDLEVLLRYEQGDFDGDGSIGQNHALFPRNSHRFAINDVGYARSEWKHAILEVNQKVAVGDGMVTGIAAWRDYEGGTDGDIDSTPATAFHARQETDQDQVSGELRYAGTFGPTKVTLGGFVFEQDLLYVEERTLDTNLADTVPPVVRVGGGKGEFSTWALFGAVDWELTSTVTLNLGLRYSHEAKDADISRIRRAADSLGGAAGPDLPGEGVIGGNLDAKTLNFSDTGYSPSWNDLSPKLGVQWKPDDDTQVYATWTKGFRSGGINFRHTALGTRPAVFDSEKQSALELGLKKDFLDRRVRLNAALFRNKIDGIQREQNLADPLSGVQQLITNSGDVTIQGAEAEARVRVTDRLVVTLQAGYTDGEYDKITADLSGVGGIGDPTDFALVLPRLSKWTYGTTVVHDQPLGEWGALSSRVSFNHRDKSYFTDNNLGVLNAADMLDASFTFNPKSGPWTLSLYGTNLLNETQFGNDTILPNIAAFGGDGAGPRPLPTYSPLAKGRIYGVELRVRY